MNKFIRSPNPKTMKKNPCIFCMIINLFLKKLNIDAVVTAKDKMIYQQASIIPAIEIKYKLNISSLFSDINCE